MNLYDIYPSYISDLFEYDFYESIFNKLVQKYNEPHRFYHDFRHIEKLFKKLDKHPSFHNTTFYEKQQLILAILFHDAVYNVGSKTNEIDSVEYFKLSIGNVLSEEFISGVCSCILETIHHQPSDTSPLINKILVDIDIEDLLSNDMDLLIKNQHLLYKEFQKFTPDEFYTGTIDFLTNFNKNRNNEGVKKLIDYVKFRYKPSNLKIAVYPGSFNPFHIGHLDILKKAEDIFDKVIIFQGQNPDKTLNNYELPAYVNYRQVIKFQGLLTDALKEHNLLNATVVKGLRNADDLNYELKQNWYNKRFNQNFKMVTFFSDYPFVSSSDIRYLLSKGLPTSNLIVR